MNREERRKRLEELLKERKMKENKLEAERRIAEMLALFPDQANVEILDDKESDRVENEMTEVFPFAWYGRIDWNQWSNKMIIANEDIADIPAIISSLNIDNAIPVYLIVGIYKYPLAKTSLPAVLDNIEEVMSMGADQYIYCPLSKYVIEFSHDDIITLGWL
ncbi:hypothetical protein [Lysinibacillus odysseyi]|uniref:Uncharacterized protein n=1 Tax=Lysinibacillus odysseyi 34hs-1 = NBRC 100172 TaxID=1220589 RepID=A0A0A3JEP7_9BACI|nr:hypothetical protein [Lysinibacillus odysseyi]KGR85522.1 hypothetical protein CD32_09930 [Lysinibacillus odysseyi 34hs-1 = NBRC 100172]